MCAELGNPNEDENKENTPEYILQERGIKGLLKSRAWLSKTPVH